MNSIITTLTKACKPFFEKYKSEIADIILFGSLMRGKQNPSDVDVLLLFLKKIDKDTEYALRKKLEQVVPLISILSKTQKTMIDPSFVAREAILFEGYSLVFKEQIASRYGHGPWGMFLYKTKGMTNVDKTRWYYALNGRHGSRGIAHALSAIKLSDCSMLIPLSKIEEAKAFFEQWKIEYVYSPILLPERIAKRHILQKEHHDKI